MDDNNSIQKRERWGSRLGLILAVAGNAVGLGNFLRFPVQAAENGGGSFMIPYFIFFLLLGIPLMWIEWGIGRYGGKYNHGSTPGMFSLLWKNPIAKYLGALGLVISMSIMIYYTYIESWTLAFSFFSLNQTYFGLASHDSMRGFLYSFQGKETSDFFTTLWPAYACMIVTFFLNFWILYKGVSKGIERLAYVAMPLLFIFGIILTIRVIFLGTPNPAIPENSIANGFSFIWNLNFDRISEPRIWLAAAGQIFFTLSLGMGAIHVYASYLKPKDDIVASGLSTAIINEVAEVGIGGSIAIPAATAFFGVTLTTQIAAAGAFDLGFVSMPLIFEKIPLGFVFGTLWFLLLFLAGITSSVAMGQPFIAFLEDEFGYSRKKATIILASIVLVSIQFVIFFLDKGFLDEMDYWAGTFGLVVFALIETILFMWVFGSKKAWEEMNEGGDFRIPKIFLFVMKFITPIILLGIMLWWLIQDAIPILLLYNIESEKVPFIWGARALMLIITALVLFMIKRAWLKKSEIGQRIS
jgi:neurotransmitter:Na+ symporter, NSS family